MPREEAEPIAEESRNMSPAQVRRMYREQKGDNGPIRILKTTIEVIPHNPLRVYNDGKRRKITVNGVPFEWECAPEVSGTARFGHLVMGCCSCPMRIPRIVPISFDTCRWRGVTSAPRRYS